MGVYEKKDKTLFEYVCNMGDTLRKEYIMEDRLKNLEKKVKEMTILLVAIIFFVGVVFGFSFTKLRMIHDDVKDITTQLKLAVKSSVNEIDF